MRQNLIPNPDFQDGLIFWEGTPVGVTLVDMGRQRYVQLIGTETIAAICSDPIEIVIGATYRFEVDRALKSGFTIQVLSENFQMKVENGDEVVLHASPIRVQITAGKKEKAFISRVSVVPIGKRVNLTEVRTNAWFVDAGKPFRILANVHNVGSEVVSGASANLVTRHHKLAEEHKASIKIPDISVGESVPIEWTILSQSRAYSEFRIDLTSGGETVSATEGTLRHKPGPPEVRSLKSVEGNKRWFTVSTRKIRFTARETDADFGPVHIGDEVGKKTYGVIHHLCRILLDGDENVNLWFKVKSVMGSKVELISDSKKCFASLTLFPDLREGGIGIDLIVKPKVRLRRCQLEIGPFEFLEDMPLQWIPASNSIDSIEEHGEVLYGIRTVVRDFAPGTNYKLSGILKEQISGIVRR